LGHGQVGAIQHLVAAAVVGLEPARVAIVDDKGDLLAGGDAKNGPDADAADQEQQTADVEDKLRQRIESMVSSIVGPGHARVQVAADMDYKHQTTTSETYDPDSKVIRSTSTTEQNSSDTNGSTNGAVSVSTALPGATQQTPATDSAKSTSGREEETTNYEISKTVTNSVVDGGTVKHLSVAVVVDGNTKTDPSGKETYTPRSAQDLAQITSLVKSAMGFNKDRGDEVQVVNMPFAHLDVADATPAPKPLMGLDSGYWFKIIEAAILSITALLMGLFVVRPLINRMFAPSQAGGGSNALFAAQHMSGQLPAPAAASGDSTLSPISLPSPRESMIDVSRIEGQVRESSIKKVGEVVSAHPEEALAIIRTWLHEPV
jgi:flagellar M-ring protein FliF